MSKLDTTEDLTEVPTQRLAEEMRRRGYESKGEVTDGAVLSFKRLPPFDLLDPDPGHPVLGITEIARRLAREYRYSNASRYTVAQHSMLVSKMAPEGHKFAALLHDAAEALIKDIPLPAKQLCQGYKRLEENIESAVEERYGVDLSAPEVSEADHAVYSTELASDAVPTTDKEGNDSAVEILLPIRILPERAARHQFLEQHYAVKDE